LSSEASEMKFISISLPTGRQASDDIKAVNTPSRLGGTAEPKRVQESVCRRLACPWVNADLSPYAEYHERKLVG
jgi:hypothetical protein